MGRGYVAVEGHGEVTAAGNLITRLGKDLGLHIPWAAPIRRPNLHQKASVQLIGNAVRARRDTEALLVMRDEDDHCPKERGPEMARWLRELALPFPAAVVLLRPEYEVLFLPSLPRMAGVPIGAGKAARPAIVAGTRWEAGWEQRRGIKEWLSQHYPPGRRYRPTTDQLELTRMIDFGDLRQAGVPCFGTLERALGFLATHRGQSAVYPS